MLFNYTEKLSSIYNELARCDLAKKTHGGMWYETHGLAIYTNKDAKTEAYLIRSEHPNATERDKMTEKLTAMFAGYPYVTVQPGRPPQIIGPRS